MIPRLKGYQHGSCCDVKDPHQQLQSPTKMRCEYFCSRELKVTFSQYESGGQISELLIILVIMSQEVLAMKLLFCVAV